jgi:hypothetical protein
MMDGTVSTTNDVAAVVASDHDDQHDQDQQDQQDQRDDDQPQGSKILLYTIYMTQTAVLSRQSLRDRSTRDPRRLDLIVNRAADIFDNGFGFVHFIPIEDGDENRQKKFGKRLQQATSRVTAKLAQLLQPYFNLAGYGVSITLYGAVLSLVTMEIIEIVLTNVGTEKVNVETKRGGTFCLWGNVATRRLLGLTDTEPLGFHHPHEGIAASQGLHFLSDHLSRPPAKDIYTKYEQQEMLKFVKLNLSYIVPTTKEHQPIERTQYLGGGAPKMFSIVYQLDKTSVLKLPIVKDAVANLQNEQDKLQQLQPHPAIPQAASWALAYFQKGNSCSATTLQGIRMVGLVGKPASDYTKDHVDVLTNIYHGIRAALEYANVEKKIIHMNVRPRHIIVDAANPTNRRVQLISWGCATSTSETLRAFRGSGAFAHDELLLYQRPSEYHPKPAYDMASFAYTMAAILYEITDQPPWCSGWYEACANDLVYLKRRRTQAIKLVEGSRLSAHIKSELIMAM